MLEDFSTVIDSLPVSSDKIVTDILVDHKGSVFFCTWGEGVVVYHGDAEF